MIISKDLFLLGDQEYLRLPKEDKRPAVMPVEKIVDSNERGDGIGTPCLSPEQRHQLAHAQKPLELVFSGVTVSIEERLILSDVSGIVKPGQLLAVMGPSGSGKTTLLNCLSGRKKLDSGVIKLNGDRLNKRYKRKICYVLQQDVFFPGLTLRETLQYAARLRLPESWSYSQKMQFVDHLVNVLDLDVCQDTLIGNFLSRGLSGGEKKRGNIACELLTNPALMLLDEPTSGLDSHAAHNLILTLKKYAENEHKTVVVTVHQPSSQIFHMFDKLLLLTNGQTAYFGDADKVVDFFANIGLQLKPHFNPADFILEKIKESDEVREKIMKAWREFSLQSDYTHEIHELYADTLCDRYIAQMQSNGHVKNWCNGEIQPSELSVEGRQVCQALCNNNARDENNCLYTSITMKEEECKSFWPDNQSHSSGSSFDYDISWQWPTCFWTQFKVLCQRNFREARPRMLSKLNWIQTISLGIMAGLLWYQLPRTEEAIHDIQGWMFFSTTYWMLFAHFSALYSFPAEREVINKERLSGSYRLSAYYFAKMAAELPLTIALPALYHLISYPMLGVTSWKVFFYLMAFLLLNTVVAQSVGFFVGAWCMDVQVSITVSAIYTLGTQLFGGYLSNNIPTWMTWMQRLSLVHYGYQNMQLVEFSEGAPILCGHQSKYAVCKNMTYIPAEDIMAYQVHIYPLPIWANSLILILYLIIFRLLGYMVLRYIRKPK